jgi:hypothetical protein
LLTTTQILARRYGPNTAFKSVTVAINVIGKRPNTATGTGSGMLRRKRPVAASGATALAASA